MLNRTNVSLLLGNSHANEGDSREINANCYQALQGALGVNTQRFYFRLGGQV